MTDLSLKFVSAENGRFMRGVQFSRLTAFAAVAEHASFTRAAKQLGISTPSISMAVRSLEDELGVRLLNRTTRSVGLTEAGEHLTEHLRPLIDGLDRAIDAVNAFRDKPAGTLRLTVHPIAALTLLAPLVATFSNEYPSIHLDITVDGEPKDTVSTYFDAGIHHVDDIADDMVVAPIGGELPICTVASPAYLAHSGRPQFPEELRDHNCVSYRWANVAGDPSWSFDKQGQDAKVAPDGSLTVNEFDLALRAALDGAGIVQLPEVLVSSHIAEGRLVSLLQDWTSEWPPFVIYYSCRRHVPHNLRAFIDFFRTNCRKRVQMTTK
jgi:DNA-binding transcriptional LysR family regulator